MRWTGSGGGFEAIFEELAAEFERCSTVLQRVRDQVRAHTNADILSLYEQWIAHPDQATEEKLTELGVMPAPNGPSSEGVRAKGIDALAITSSDGVADTGRTGTVACNATGCAFASGGVTG